MADLKTFRAIRPAEGYAEKTAALPYDVFSLEEAKAETAKESLSFLAIDRPEIIAGKGEDIYAAAGARLKEQILRGYYTRDEETCFYIYELTAYGRSQAGIVALTKVDDYISGVIHRHENTRADKEADRVAHVRGCMAQTGPIFLTYRAKTEIKELTASIMKKQNPVFEFQSSDSVRHRGFKISDESLCRKLQEAFGAVKDLYIADGHHRCAAAAAYALQMRKDNPGYCEEEPWNYILSVVFPDDELKIMDYNRVVRDFNGLTEKQLLSKIGKYFDVEFSGDDLAEPKKKGLIGMYVKSGWYTLYLKEEYMSADPVEGLDVSLLQKYVLEPVFGIKDPRRDKRIAFVGGIRGTKELIERVNAQGGAAFWMHPTSMAELLAVADAGKLMPPKSTWFEPKLRSGLFIHSLEV